MRRGGQARVQTDTPDIERAFGDQYFIKRLIASRDTVEIREP